jgi:adenine-specific DNA-methyltransferase
MTKEQRFFNALRDIFVGARVEGQSGFINLMRIKSRYYEEGVFPRLKEDIDRALEPFPEFREELFDRLYAFFCRYFTESGSIGFHHTPFHERVYEQVYTDDRDVALFWKTHMLYYVKTDRLFHSMDVEVDGFRFHFDVSTLEHRQANEKRALVYTFRERRDDGTLVFTVALSAKGRTTSMDAIRRAIRDAMGLSRYTPAVPSEETLERAIRLFERQSQVDYFINKDARAFLQEQLDLWLYQYVFEPEERRGTLWTEGRVRQLQVLRDIASKIIHFIAQFEDELVRIWNKPRFVLESHYIITLDRISAQEGGPGLLEQLLNHPGMAAQVQEWRDLGMVDENFSPAQIGETDLLGHRLHPRYQYLPLDTRHFPDLEESLIGLFDGLDDALDGWLVHSENYQALLTMQPRFQGRVKCIYIDPPYNTGHDEFIYEDRFQHSSWLTMMENRLRLAEPFLTDDGFLAMSIGEEELPRARLLLEHIFGPSNYRNTLLLRRYDKNINRQFMESGLKSLNVGAEYVLLFGKSDSAILQPVFRAARTDRQGKGYWKSFWNAADRPTMRYELFGVTPETGQWKWKREVALEAAQNYAEYLEKYAAEMTLEEYWERTGCRKRFLRRNPRGGGAARGVEHWVPPSGSVLRNSNWSDLLASESLDDMGLFFSSPKSVAWVSTLLTLCAVRDGEMVLDFFAGSGTTAHAVIHLNRRDGLRRRYILVEMGDHFHTVLLPRIKKAIFSDRWRGGRARPDGRGISHFVKYFRLEQYEDILRRATYEDTAPRFFQGDPYAQYVFLRDRKMLTDARTGEPVATLDPETDTVRVDLGKLYENIDLGQTLSFLTGKRIRRLSPDCVVFEDGETVSLTAPPWNLTRPLIFWR